MAFANIKETLLLNTQNLFQFISLKYSVTHDLLSAAGLFKYV